MLLVKASPGGRGLRSGRFYDWTGDDPVDVDDLDALQLLEEEPEEFTAVGPQRVDLGALTVRPDAERAPLKVFQDDPADEDDLAQPPVLTAVDTGAEPVQPDSTVVEQPVPDIEPEPLPEPVSYDPIPDPGVAPVQADSAVEPVTSEPAPAREPAEPVTLAPLPDDGSPAVAADSTATEV